MVVGQGVTSRFFDFGVVGRCFKQRWGHLGGVFSELGVRGGRMRWRLTEVVELTLQIMKNTRDPEVVMLN